jgi:hypothetical protein
MSNVYERHCVLRDQHSRLCREHDSLMRAHDRLCRINNGLSWYEFNGKYRCVLCGRRILHRSRAIKAEGWALVIAGRKLVREGM